MSVFLLSLKMLRRDWRACEWRVLLLALVLAVGSLATVGLFADRVRQALQQQAHELIGADLRISSSRPIASDFRIKARELGLQTAQSRTFPSMVMYREQVLLSEIRAVEAGYPLRGRIVIDDGKVHDASGIPARGSVWADDGLLRRFDLRVGDEVGIGARRFRVGARIVKDIDQSAGFASFAPRVLMNDDDLASTGLVQEGSRINHRLLIAGAPEQVQALRTALQPQLNANEKMEDVRDARPEIRIALERAEHFMGLAALTATILAAAALALAARSFVLRHLDACAVMRCLGAQQWQILWLFLCQFVLFGVLAVILGGLLGYATQAALVESIATLREAGLPQPGVLPLFKAAASGMALLLAFAFLPLLQLRKVSPLRVMRRELGLPEASAWSIYTLAAGVLAALFLWQAGSLKLGLTVLAGLLAGLLLFGWLAWVVLQTWVIFSGYLPVCWRHACHNLARHRRSAALQIVALSLGGMALLVLTLVRTDLLQSWQGKLPLDAPNRFVIHIQPDQLSAVTAFFARHGLQTPLLLPMVRGRLLAINDHIVGPANYADSRAQGLVEREFNLSYMAVMPHWNELASGAWWTDAAARELSVEEGIAQTLGIRLGDRLTYDVAGSRFSARVSSLRKVQWDSMRVNFFVIASPALLMDFPASYLGSFYLPAEKAAVGDALAREFPNLLLIDTGAVIEQVRAIMDQIAQVVSALFLFTLSSGLVVLYAALLATRDERSQEAAILRTLGADSRYLLRLHLAEFVLLGGLGGLFAAGGAVVLGWVLARRVLDVAWQFNPAIALAGLAGGVLLVTLSGWLATRQLRQHSPLRILAAD